MFWVGRAALVTPVLVACGQGMVGSRVLMLEQKQVQNLSPLLQIDPECAGLKSRPCRAWWIFIPKPQSYQLLHFTSWRTLHLAGKSRQFVDTTLLAA